MPPTDGPAVTVLPLVIFYFSNCNFSSFSLSSRFQFEVIFSFFCEVLDDVFARNWTRMPPTDGPAVTVLR